MSSSTHDLLSRFAAHVMPKEVHRADFYVLMRIKHVTKEFMVSVAIRTIATSIRIFLTDASRTILSNSALGMNKSLTVTTPQWQYCNAVHKKCRRKPHGSWRPTLPGGP